MKYILILFMILLIFLNGCAMKDCQTDIICFKEAAKNCLRAKVNIIHEGNNIRLTSRGIWFDKCKLSLKIEEIGDEVSKKNPTLARIAKSKTLNCVVPVEIVEYDRDKYIEEILLLEDRFNEYCSGPIKDALQGPLKEVIREKIQESIVLS